MDLCLVRAVVVVGLIVVVVVVVVVGLTKIITYLTLHGSGDFQVQDFDVGSSDEERETKQQSSNRRSSSQKGKRTKECPGCGAVLNLSVRECRLCDYQFTSKSLSNTNQSAAQESSQIRERFPFEPERVSIH